MAHMGGPVQNATDNAVSVTKYWFLTYINEESTHAKKNNVQQSRKHKIQRDFVFSKVLTLHVKNSLRYVRVAAVQTYAFNLN